MQSMASVGFTSAYGVCITLPRRRWAHTIVIDYDLGFCFAVLAQLLGLDLSDDVVLLD